jgi:hypothetical protein
MSSILFSPLQIKNYAKTESPFLLCVNIQQQMVLPMIGISYIWVPVWCRANHSEATSVSPEGRISRRFGLWKTNKSKDATNKPTIIGQNSVPGIHWRMPAEKPVQHHRKE